MIFPLRESNLFHFLGETSAGKSSMLNLILGEELLPFSVLSTTSTICELKYGSKRQIKIHYKEQGKDPRTKDLEESSSYMDQISEFVHVKTQSLREKASDYKKVELFWPHRLLKVRSLHYNPGQTFWNTLHFAVKCLLTPHPIITPRERRY